MMADNAIASNAYQSFVIGRGFVYAHNNQLYKQVKKRGDIRYFGYCDGSAKLQNGHFSVGARYVHVLEHLAQSGHGSLFVIRHGCHWLEVWHQFMQLVENSTIRGLVFACHESEEHRKCVINTRHKHGEQLVVNGRDNFERGVEIHVVGVLQGDQLFVGCKYQRGP